MLRKKIKGQEGLIAIVALGIFLLLSVFGIIIQSVTTNTVSSVKNTNKYYEASDIADSVMEYLQYEINNRDAGYNYSPQKCVYGTIASPIQSPSEEECANMIEEHDGYIPLALLQSDMALNADPQVGEVCDLPIEGALLPGHWKWIMGPNGCMGICATIDDFDPQDGDGGSVQNILIDAEGNTHNACGIPNFPVDGLNNQPGTPCLQDDSGEFMLIETENNSCDAVCIVGVEGGAQDPGPNPPSDLPENEPICNNILENLGYIVEGVPNENISIDMEIKGRSEEGIEEFKGDCSNSFGNGCYVVPFPGTGDAGERCDLYTPEFIQNSSAEWKVDDNGQVHSPDSGEGEIKQINYSCNWNKLSFGSSNTDRVAIPFYFELPDGTIKSPYFNNPTTPENEAEAQQFVVRIRPPCLPCAEQGENPEFGVTRGCDDGEDETICEEDVADGERYTLDTSENDIIVQWQISGVCMDAEGNEEECGVIQKLDEESQMSSSITESRINDGDPPIYQENEVLLVSSFAVPTHLSMPENPMPILAYLINMQKPVLTLFLSDKLISNADKNIPYLEYQVLAKTPIANPKIKADVTIIVDGNIFTKTLYKEEQKPLIDFAIHN